MSMNYGIVWPSFWTGSTGRQLRGDANAQLVALYLMTSPHGNSLGIYRCPLQYITLETGCPIEGALKGLRRLCEIGFCTFDEATETIWVREMARYQIGADLKPQDKRQKHIQRIFDQIENKLIQQCFFEKYGSSYHLTAPPVPPKSEAQDEGTSKPLPSPSEANNNFNFNINNNFKTDSLAHPSDDAETENQISKSKAKAAKPRKQIATSDGFDEFWSACPLKKSRAAALKAWPKAVASGATPAEITAAMRRYAIERAGQDPRYTKHPSTWLNAGCWADEPASPLGHASTAGLSGYAQILFNRHMERSGEPIADAYDHQD